MTAGAAGTGPGTARRAVLVPDLDDELVVALNRVEELLLVLDFDGDPRPRLGHGEAERVDQVDGSASGEVLALPAPLDDRVALEALNRVQAAVGPTQTRYGRPAPAGGRLLGADGRYEHRSLRLVHLDAADLQVLAAAAAVLGEELATRPHSALSEAMTDGAEAAGGITPYGPATTPQALVEALARAHGLLDLAVTDDTRALAARVADLDHGDVVLTPAEDTAYERLAGRFNAMWTLSDPLARWTY